MDRRHFRSHLGACSRIVIKVGTSSITKENGDISLRRLKYLAEEVASLHAQGKQVIIVTSGAVGAGCVKFQCGQRPRTISEKQAAAAVGQTTLMHRYEVAFASSGLSVAQVLFTRVDMMDRRRFLNARDTILLLVRMGVIPIVNENDTMADEQIRFGDNDTLSAFVAGLTDSGLLIILSDIDGLCTDDPRMNPSAHLVPLVSEITPQMWRWATRGKGKYSVGGMTTKLGAAAVAMRTGTFMVIANGSIPGVCTRIIQGEPIGTLFVPRAKPLNKRRQWVVFGTCPVGRVRVDDGAKEALLRQGKSLLPGGIMAVEGDFAEGSVVSVIGSDGREIARGVVNYSSEHIRRIAGHRSTEIEEVLSFKYASEVMHRDNMALSDLGDFEQYVLSIANKMKNQRG